MDGDFKEYYKNGKIKTAGKYFAGNKEGPWTEYDETGKVLQVTKFKAVKGK
jgi:antitoxin component YwqK of YwqJK toxin-antitoxin module